MGVSVAIMLALAAACIDAGEAPVQQDPAPMSACAADAVEPIDKRGYTLFRPTPRGAMRDFATDRPDTTESPFTVDAGHVQIEFSLAGYTAGRDGSVRMRSLDILPMNLKVGLTNAIDLQLVFTPFQRVVTRDGGARSVSAGFGDDTQVRLKINLRGNDGGRTAFAVMPFVKAPAGGERGNGHVEGGLIVPLAFDLAGGFSLGTMMEFDLVYDASGDGGRGDYGIDAVHSATVGHALIGRLEGYVEYVGVVPRGGGGGYRATASTGLTYRLRDDWNIDAGGAFGLSGRSDDATVFTGMSLRF